MFNVERVKDHPLVERGVTSSTDLPQAGNSWWNAESDKVAILILFDFFGEWRSRPDEAHIAFQDVEQLREFIEAKLSKDSSDWCNPWVIFHFEDGTIFFIFRLEFCQSLVGIFVHRSEFIEGERFSEASDACLAIENGAWAGEFYEQGDTNEQRGKHENQCGASCYIEDSFPEGIRNGYPRYARGKRHFGSFTRFHLQARSASSFYSSSSSVRCPYCSCFSLTGLSPEERAGAAPRRLLVISDS